MSCNVARKKYEFQLKMGRVHELAPKPLPRLRAKIQTHPLIKKKLYGGGGVQS